MRSLRKRLNVGVSEKKNKRAPTRTSRNGEGALKRAVTDGDMENGCILAGQSAAMVKKIQPAAEIIKEIFVEAEKILGGSDKWVK
jgi:NAD(P)H-dependent flavin oxidoreductase YrpB (nitropropane dioxygenase family)